MGSMAPAPLNGSVNPNFLNFDLPLGLVGFLVGNYSVCSVTVLSLFPQENIFPDLPIKKEAKLWRHNFDGCKSMTVMKVIILIINVFINVLKIDLCEETRLNYYDVTARFNWLL